MLPLLVETFNFQSVCYFWRRLGLISVPIPGLSVQLDVDPPVSQSGSSLDVLTVGLSRVGS